MKIAGISLIANGIQLRYPFEACIRNLLACTDHVFVNTDINNKDNTIQVLERIREETGRLTILETEWNWGITNGTDLAYRANQCIAQAKFYDYDMVLYVQADEVINPQEVEYVKITTLAYELVNIALERIYFWQDLHHINDSWTMKLPRLCILSPYLYVVDDGMSMHVDHSLGTYIELDPKICRIYHYSRVGNTKAIAQRLNNLDMLFHPIDEFVALADYTFGINNNYEEGIEDAIIKTININHPPGIEEFYNEICK